jgi:hypothetical protein
MLFPLFLCYSTAKIEAIKKYKNFLSFYYEMFSHNSAFETFLVYKMNIIASKWYYSTKQVGNFMYLQSNSRIVNIE